ncbi:glycosyl transferase family 2 [Halobacillus halophilus]|uniref:Group 2 glycosyltransferase n=1 Tax=Halobacillus halophilus (strain ATCC 35676 / DSM 2266 / JCM 20832 / KCTC 3685 / LMG 17431 / NBRC 102448 / NCIMB 2269) TaxID=866895 RepID=I0JJM6_HALH3|nr:glycosyltransferase family 2 protein [Halobacillus halophilus]ASF38499.1 glycosyl transferase family 2 [Halobacillus halophilus]CCG44344.1 group 2 glycosyltransferase [Halobacillus halophilus DSM 2266]
MIKYSVVIPCYNEEKNIPLILKRFNQVINRNDIEVVLINNGSKDNSRITLSEVIPKYSFAKTYEVKVNQGYGYGILYGLQKAKGEYLGWTHADMQTDPNDVMSAIEEIEKNRCPQNIYIKGKRKNRPVFDQVFSIGMSIYETILLRTKLVDINAQPNLFHRSFYDSLTDAPKDFSLDLYFLYMAQKKKQKIHRFEVSFPERLHGHSSWNTGLSSKWKFIKRTLSFSTKLRKEYLK